VAAQQFEGAPTLDELAGELSRTSQYRISRTAYLARLEDITDLPAERPLPIGWPPPGAAAPGPSVSPTFTALIQDQPRLDALLAQAIERVEDIARPEAVETFAKLMEDAPSKRVSGPAVVLAAELAGRFRRPPPVSALGPGPPPDKLTLLRAEALVWDPGAGVGAWAPSPRVLPSTPAGTVWAFCCALALVGLFRFVRSLEHRRAYLRRRPPAQSPLRTKLMAEALKRASQEELVSRPTIRSLQQRSTQESDQLDIEATIRATIAGGGRVIEPRFAKIRSSPDYLVFIERRAPGDQQALRLLGLVDALRTLLHVEVFFYQSDTAYLERERGGPAAPIEQLMATHPRHRLIVLGSGLEFLDPVDHQLRAAAEKLLHWQRRALLTPLPALEWAEEEPALARALAAPVGRATPAGLGMLGDLLRLESAAAGDALLFAGNDLELPLPRRLRTRPLRYLQAAPPQGETVPELLVDLKRYLGDPGFDWLCALAVYPEVQFDLTLYLGLGLAETAGGDGGAARIYTESRLAALTQLPWLQLGRMPVWLRRALIAALPKARSNEIRKLLAGLIRDARATPGTPAAVVLQIGVEPASHRRAEAVFRDEVLIDFLARGDAEDFRLPEHSVLDRIVPPRLRPFLDWQEAAGVLVAASFLTAGLLLTPRPGGSVGGADAWLPLVCVALCASPAAFLVSPRAAVRLARSAAMRLAPAALTLALFGLAMLGQNQIDAAGRPWLPVLLIPTPALPPLSWWLFGLVGGPIARKRGGWVGLAGLAFEMLLTWVLCGAAVAAANAIAPGAVFTLVVAGAAGFALGWLAVLTDRPARVADPPPMSASATALRLAGALALIAPAFTLQAWMQLQTTVLRPPSPAAVLTAVSPRGDLLAVAEAGGAVNVYDLGSRDPSTPVARTTCPPGVALAVGRRKGRPIVALAAADGSTCYRDPSRGDGAAWPGNDAHWRAPPAKLAFDLSGALFEAIATPDGKQWLRVHPASDAAARPWREVTYDFGGVYVSAVGAAGPDAFVVGLDDGRIALVTSNDSGSIEVQLQAARLSGAARMIRLIETRDDGVSTFWAIGADGSRLEGTVSNGRMTLKSLPPIDALDLEIPNTTPATGDGGRSGASPIGNDPTDGAPSNGEGPPDRPDT
jgi:hypothetical protein